MASDVGGEVKYIIDADDKKFVVKIQEASKEFNKFVDTISDSSTKVEKSLNKGFSEGTASAIKSLNKLTDSAVNGFATISKSIASISFNTLTTAAGTASAALTSLITGGITDTQFLENTQIQMQGLTHSIEGGNKAMAYATQYFKNNPFNRFDVTSATKAMIQFGTAIDDVPAMLDKMGKVSLSTGVNISELATLYAKSSADGRVGLIDIQMLAERGVPIWDAFAKATGKSSAQIREETAKGGVAVADFQKAFDYLVDDNAMEQFNNTFSRQVDRFKGRLSNMKGAIAGYTMDVDKGFTASANGLYKAVTNLTKAFADAMDSEPGKKLLASLTKLGEALAPIIDKLATLIPPAIEKAANALDYIANHTETLIPILGSALVLFGRLGANLPGIGGIIGSLGGNFKTILNILNPFQGGIFGVVKAFSALSVVLGMIGLVKNGSVPELFQVLKKVFSQVQVVIKNLLPVFMQTAEVLGNALLKSLEAILPTIPPIVEAIGKLANAFGRAVANVAPTVFRALAVALQAIAFAINAIPQPILDALVTGLVALMVAAKVSSAINKLNATLDVFRGKLPGIQQDLNNTVTTIAEAGTQFSKVAKEGFGKVIEILTPFGTAISAAATVAVKGLKTAGTFILGFGKSIASVFTSLGSIVVSALGAVAKTVGSIVGTMGKMLFDGFAKIAKGIGSLFAKLGSVIWKYIAAIGSKIGSVFAKIGANIWGILSKLGNNILKLVQGIASSVSRIVGQIGSAIAGFANKVLTALVSLKNKIFTGAGKIAAKVKEIATTVAGYVANFAKAAADKLVAFGNAAKNAFAKFADVVKSAFSAGLEHVKNFGAKVGEVFSVAFGHVKDFASKVAGVLQQVGSKIAKFMEPAVTAVSNFVTKATQAIKNFAASIVTKYLAPLGQKIGGIFDAAGNKISGSLSKITNNFKNTFGKTKQAAQETSVAVEQLGTKASSAFSKVFGKAKTESDSAANSIKNVSSAATESATNLAKAGAAGQTASTGLKATKQGADAAKEGITSISDGVKGLFDVLSNTVQGIMNVLNTLAKGVTTVLQTTLGGIGQAIKALLEPLSDGNLLKGVGVLAGVAATLVVAAVALQLLGSINIGWGTLLNNLLQMTVAIVLIGALAIGVGALMDTGIGAALLASGLAAIAGVAATIMVTALAMKVAAESMPDNMGDVAKRIGEGLSAIMAIDFGGFFKNMQKMGAAAAAAGTTAMVASIGKSLNEIVALNLPEGSAISDQVNKIGDAYDIIKEKFLENGGGVLGGIVKFFVGGENDSNQTLQVAAKTTEYIKNLAEGLKQIGLIELPDQGRIETKLDNIYKCFEIIKSKFIDRSDGVIQNIWNWVAGKENSDSSMIQLVAEVIGYVKTVADNIAELGKMSLPSAEVMTPVFEKIEGYANTIKEKFIDDSGGVWRAIGEWFGGKKDADTSQIEIIKNVSGALKEIATNISTIASLNLEVEGVNKTLSALETIMTNIKAKFVETDKYNLGDEVKTALETVKSVAESLTAIGNAFSTIPAMDPTATVTFVTNVGTVLDKIASTFTGENKTVDISGLSADMSGYAQNAATIAESLISIGKSFTELPALDSAKAEEYLGKINRVLSAIMVMFVENAPNPYGFANLNQIGISSLADTIAKVDTAISNIANVVNNLKTITDAVANVVLPEETKITDFLSRANQIISGINKTFLGGDEEAGENGGVKLDPAKWGAEGSIVKGIANIVNVINNIKLIAEAVNSTNTSADVTKFNEFVGLLGTMFDNIAKSLEGKMDAMLNIGVQYGAKLAEGMKSKELDIYNQGVEWQGKVWNGLNERIEDIKTMGKSFGDKFKDGLREKYTVVKEAGQYLAQGFIDGMNSKSWQVQETARTLADQANTAFRNTLNIKSPSRVFYANGEYVGIGLIKGMQDQYKEVADTARGLADAITEPFDDINDFSVNIAGQVSRDEGTGFGSPNKTYNITQNNNINNGPSYAKMLADLKWEMFKS